MKPFEINLDDKKILIDLDELFALELKGNKLNLFFRNSYETGFEGSSITFDTWTHSYLPIEVRISEKDIDNMLNDKENIKTFALEYVDKAMKKAFDKEQEEAKVKKSEEYQLYLKLKDKYKGLD